MNILGHMYKDIHYPSIPLYVTVCIVYIELFNLTLIVHHMFTVYPIDMLLLILYQTLFIFPTVKGSRKKSSSLNGRAIKAHPSPPSSLMAVGTLEKGLKKFEKKNMNHLR